MRVSVQRSRVLGAVSLLTSFGTLICCALPAVLVLVGLGATVATVLSNVPWLVTFSRHKPLVFSISGALIAANVSYVLWLAPRLRASGGDQCAPDAPDACADADRFSRVVLWASVAIYLVGIFTAFALGPILASTE